MLHTYQIVTLTLQADSGSFFSAAGRDFDTGVSVFPRQLTNVYFCTKLLLRSKKKNLYL